MRNDNARWALSLGLDRPAIQTAVLTMSIVLPEFDGAINNRPRSTGDGCGAAEYPKAKEYEVQDHH